MGTAIFNSELKRIRLRLEDSITKNKERLKEVQAKIARADSSAVSELTFDKIQAKDAIALHEQRLEILYKIVKNQIITLAEHKLLLNFEDVTQIAEYKNIKKPLKNDEEFDYLN